MGSSCHHCRRIIGHFERRGEVSPESRNAAFFFCLSRIRTRIYSGGCAQAKLTGITCEHGKCIWPVCLIYPSVSGHQGQTSVQSLFKHTLTVNEKVHSHSRRMAMFLDPAVSFSYFSLNFFSISRRVRYTHTPHLLLLLFRRVYTQRGDLFAVESYELSIGSCLLYNPQMALKSS